MKANMSEDGDEVILIPELHLAISVLENGDVGIFNLESGKREIKEICEKEGSQSVIVTLPREVESALRSAKVAILNSQAFFRKAVEDARI